MECGYGLCPKKVTFPMFNFTNGYGEWHLKYNNMRHTGFSLLALIKD